MERMKYEDEIPPIPILVFFLIFLRTLVAILLTLAIVCTTNPNESDAKIRYIVEFSMLFLLVGPYLIAGVVLHFNRKRGMKCLVIVSVFEFLLDMASLIFNFQVFWGTTCISYVEMGSGYLNTPFSSGILLYFGTKWAKWFIPAENKLEIDGIALGDDDTKWYQSKRDIVFTILITIFGICAYGDYYFEINHFLISVGFMTGYWRNVQFIAVVLLLEGVSIELKHYWNWITITAGSMLIRVLMDECMWSSNFLEVIWEAVKHIYPVGDGACMFSVAVLVYVVRKNIERGRIKHG